MTMNGNDIWAKVVTEFMQDNPDSPIQSILIDCLRPLEADRPQSSPQPSPQPSPSRSQPLWKQPIETRYRSRRDAYRP